MKTLALLAALILHATGLWSRLPASTHSLVTSAATTASLHAAPDIAPDRTPLGPLPIQAGSEALTVSAASAYAVDLDSGTVLYSKNPTSKRPIASVTKLVTALVVMSHHDPAEQISVPELPKYLPEDEIMGLQPGEVLTIGQLVQAALIQSAADAADTLAIIDSGSIPKFAATMNAKMGGWGIAGTHFTNASGLQDQDNYSTAQALSQIARLALVNPNIKTWVGWTNATFVSGAGRRFELTSTNTLLSNGGFYGIKTGYTPAAGECFVGLTRIRGHDVITVVLGSSNRFGDSTTLANWISRNWQWL